MKSMKKLVTLLLSLVMLCALAMPAMAEGDGNYSITINGAVAGHTYTAYQVFSGVYYKGSRQNGTSADKEYLSDVEWGKDVDGTAIVKELQATTTLKKLRDKFDTVNADDTDAAEKVAYILQGLGDQSEELDEFARVVGHHLRADKNSGSAVILADDTTKKGTITGLSAGYYFVKDSDKIAEGEIATKFLVEVVGNANVTVKAQAPTFDKKIVENGTTVNGTSANVGDEITFKLTANVPDMASFDKYTFTMHDTLSEGLDFNANSVKVTVNGTQIHNTAGTSDKYTLTYPTNTESSDTFTISFNKDQLKGLVQHTDNTTTFGATIVVEYTATLNEKALNKDVETNKAYLEYTNDPSGDKIGKTPEITVYVYDFDLTVDKYDGTDGTNNTDKKLKDAVFVLYKLDETNNKKYYKQNADSKVEWVSEADKATATSQKTDENGKATFEGLKEGTYYLEETTAPDGYNKLKNSVQVKIKAAYDTNGTLNTTTDPDFKLEQDANSHYYRVQSIANKAGAVLPSTGGIGTTIFYVLGSILALGAAVLLIAKKRMNGQDR